MKIDSRIAVLIPCFNEATTIDAMVRSFREVLPQAVIYVYDNNSTDGTAEAAEKAGAIVRHESRQGKGHVVRRMFADIEADAYLLIDGDGTYNIGDAVPMIEKLYEGPYDIVNGGRIETDSQNYRSGHRFGNFVLTGLIGVIFWRQFTDILSGYKVFSRRFVKSFPGMSSGFEIETELTVHALEMEMAAAEMRTNYSNRPAGSVSKLNTYRDGFKILFTVVRLVKNERPLAFFWTIGIFLGLAATALFLPILQTYLETGLVPRFPTFILSLSLYLCSALSVIGGILLEAETLSRREFKRLHYLSIPAISSPGDHASMSEGEGQGPEHWTGARAWR